MKKLNHRTGLGVALSVLLAIVTLVVGCGDGGDGTLIVTASGEEAAEEGFPVAVEEEVLELVDGWSLSFTAVVVSYVDFALRDHHGDAAAIGVDPVVVDLHQGEPTLWQLEGVPSGRWSDVRYRIAPPTGGSQVVGVVDPAHVTLMQDNGYGMWIGAVATDGADSVEVAWGFPLDVLHTRCENGLDGTDGVVIRRGGITDAELTLHLDHLFLDNLADEDGAHMRFEAIAAAAGEDGRVTLDALAVQSLSDPRDRNGDPITDDDGALLFYEPGPFALPAHNLREFVVAAASAMGHFNGEGHCHYQVN
jgi:hypothetical protein